MPKHKDLLQEFEGIAVSSGSAERLMQTISQRIHEEMTRYNWVGFFLLDSSSLNVLLLGPYAGSLSPQPSISMNEGLCGAAASTGKTIVVDDVAGDPRYFSALELTKSEIVVPIFVSGTVVGVIDINSYFKATFSDRERIFVESCAELVGKHLNANDQVATLSGTRTK
jgi:L-methionine (R)-S-oxide reductase